jgi:cytochrome P450
VYSHKLNRAGLFEVACVPNVDVYRDQ